MNGLMQKLALPLLVALLVGAFSTGFYSTLRLERVVIVLERLEALLTSRIDDHENRLRQIEQSERRR